MHRLALVALAPSLTLHTTRPYQCLHVLGASHNGSLTHDVNSSADIVVAFQVLEAHPGPFHCMDLTGGSMAVQRTELMRWFYLLAI